MIAKLTVQTCLGLAFMAMLLFVAAGTLHWPAAWVLLAELGILGFASGLWLAWTDPDLLRERMSPFVQRDQEASDRTLMKIISLAFVVWLVFMPLDACRFGWSHVPLWVRWIGAIAIAVSLAIVHWTVLENRYAVVVVRVQRERGQHVITTGPYRSCVIRCTPARSFVCWDAPAARSCTASSAPRSSSGCSAFASRSRSARSAPSSRATRSMRQRPSVDPGVIKPAIAARISMPITRELTSMCMHH
jgi:hypothetical protein